MTHDDSQEPEIRFDDEAEHDAAPPACSACRTPIASEYYMANEAVICANCRQALEAARQSGSGTVRFARALGLGIVAAAVGAGIYFAILAITGYEIGLVAIVVGILVGGAVKIGSRERGGWVYQTLAVALTYSAIVATYIPFILQGFREQFEAQNAATDSALVAMADSLTPMAPADTAETQLAFAMSDSLETDFAEADGPVTLGTFFLAWTFLFLFAAASPVLAGLQNIIGMLIIGFALYQAWTMNRRRVLKITGPFTASTAQTVPSA